MAVGPVLRQSLQQLPHRHVAGDTGCARLLLFGRTLIDHQHPRLPRAPPVHTAQPLHHAFPCHQIANHVVGIQIDPHLTRGGRNQENRRFRNCVAAGDQAMLFQLPSRLLPLVHAPAADEQNDRSLDRLLPGLFSEGIRNLFRHLPTVAVDQRANRSGRRIALFPHEAPGPFCQHILQPLRSCRDPR